MTFDVTLKILHVCFIWCLWILHLFPPPKCVSNFWFCPSNSALFSSLQKLLFKIYKWLSNEQPCNFNVFVPFIKSHETSSSFSLSHHNPLSGLCLCSALVVWFLGLLKMSMRREAWEFYAVELYAAKCQVPWFFSCQQIQIFVTLCCYKTAYSMFPPNIHWWANFCLGYLCVATVW